MLKFWCDSRFFCWAIMLLYTYVEFLHCRASYAWTLSSCVSRRNSFHKEGLLWSFRRGMPSWSCTHSIYWVFIEQTMISVQCVQWDASPPSMPDAKRMPKIPSFPTWMALNAESFETLLISCSIPSSLTKYVDHFWSWMGFLRTILSMISRCMFAIYLKRKNNGAFPMYSFYLFGKLSSLQIRHCNEEVWTLFCLL